MSPMEVPHATQWPKSYSFGQQLQTGAQQVQSDDLRPGTGCRYDAMPGMQGRGAAQTRFSYVFHEVPCLRGGHAQVKPPRLRSQRSSMNNTKAIHLRSLQKFVLGKADSAAWQKILADLSPTDQDMLKKMFLSNAWLDYSLWWRLLIATDKTLGKGDLALIREIGAFDARENLNGIYKTFISFMRPDFIIGNASMIWKRYYDSGELRPIQVTRTSAEFWLLDWKTLPLQHELEIIGWMESALSMTGVKNLHIGHTTCMARGDDHCTFHAVWE
jgi:hypothetical protein